MPSNECSLICQDTHCKPAWLYFLPRREQANRMEIFPDPVLVSSWLFPYEKSEKWWSLLYHLSFRPRYLRPVIGRKLQVPWVHFLLIKVGTHLGLMVCRWLVLTSSFLSDYYFKVLLVLFHYRVHKGHILNISDIKDKAKYITRDMFPGREIVEHSSWHLNHAADAQWLLNEWRKELVVVVMAEVAEAATVEVAVVTVVLSFHFLFYFFSPSEFES